MGYVWVDASDVADEVIDEMTDEELIEVIEDRGYKVVKDDFDMKVIDELYKDYKTYGFTEKFQKILEDFFEEM